MKLKTVIAQLPNSPKHKWKVVDTEEEQTELAPIEQQTEKNNSEEE